MPAEPDRAPAAAPTAAVPDGRAGDPAPARQRWRLVLARAAGRGRPRRARAGRRVGGDAIEATGLPVHRPGRSERGRASRSGRRCRPGMAAEARARRHRPDRVRARVARARGARRPVCPTGWRLVDLYDVWLGAPALAGQVVAADYRIELAGAGARRDVAKAAAALLAVGPPAARTRRRGPTTVDVRPSAAARRTSSDRLGGPAGRRPGTDPLPPGPRHGPAGGGRRGPRRPARGRPGRRVRSSVSGVRPGRRRSRRSEPRSHAARLTGSALGAVHSRFLRVGPAARHFMSDVAVAARGRHDDES